MIPEASVDAALPFLASFMERRGFPIYGNEGVVLINYILDAAAPQLMALAWDEGWKSDEGLESNPYWVGAL